MARWSWHRSHGYGGPAHAFSWRNAAIQNGSYDSAESSASCDPAWGYQGWLHHPNRILAMMLTFSGMDLFDAVAHSMTTLATIGYSTRTASIAAFDSIVIEWVIIAGMMVGSLPFAHYLAMVRGGWRGCCMIRRCAGS